VLVPLGSNLLILGLVTLFHSVLSHPHAANRKLGVELPISVTSASARSLEAGKLVKRVNGLMFSFLLLAPATILYHASELYSQDLLIWNRSTEFFSFKNHF
jgi:hypothetical protein